MRWKDWFRPPRHLLIMFFAITVVSAAALAWLSWQIVLQDRDLAAQRAQEQRENAAGLAAAALQKHLSELEEQLSTWASAPGSIVEDVAKYSRGLAKDSVVLILNPIELDAYPADHLAYYPVLPASPEPAPDIFATAERMEFQQTNHDAVIAVLQELSRSPNPMIRAEALVRAARNLRKAGRPQDAVGVYRELIQLAPARVKGIPVDLLARAALCDLFDEDGLRDQLHREASGLYADLRNGRWRLLRSVYDAYTAQTRSVLGDEISVLPAATSAVSEAVQTFWRQWQTENALSARQSMWSVDRSFLILSRRSADRALALLIGSDYLQSVWASDLQPLENTHNARIALTDAQEHRVIGQAEQQRGAYSIQLPSSTGLPWTIHSISIAGGASAKTFSSRSRLVMAGVFAIAVFVLAGSYLIARGVGRELAVARLQSDFVTAVSHEFRTPLTALRQLSELLAKGRVMNESVRQQYYEVLEHESARLHRLVEGLLKFGRMEAGAMQYQLETIDVSALVQSVVTSFGAEAERRQFVVELETVQTTPVRADREALSCAIWNLLDNAVKYSTDRHTVWVNVAQGNRCVAIGVRDQGVGIAHADQERIFKKFVRGETATSLGVQGAGIGLAIAHEIIATHGGNITVESQPGMGSTFTILLPIEES